jgi:leucyl aminopeptidase
MRKPTQFTYRSVEIDIIADQIGRVAVFLDDEGRMDVSARRVNRLTKGAVARLIESERFQKMKQGQVFTLNLPVGMAAEAVDIVRLSRRATVEQARAAGASLAKLRGDADLLMATGNAKYSAQIAFGLAMRDYSFVDHKTAGETTKGAVVVMCGKTDEVMAAASPLMAVAEGAFMTRDLINEPANILTTSEFANRLVDMKSLGLKVQVLDEAERWSRR